MAARFEVLDLVPTPMGDISLWRRINPSGGDDIYEVKLGDETFIIVNEDDILGVIG